MITRNPVNKLDAINNIDHISDSLSALSEIFLVMQEEDSIQIERSFGFVSDLLFEYHETLEEATKILCEKRKSE